MFEEIGCPDELKKCKAEIERHKRFIIWFKPWSLYSKQNEKSVFMG